MKMPFLSNTRMKFLKELILYRDCFTMQETTQKCDVNKHSVKDRLGLVNVNIATVVKVVTNLIVWLTRVAKNHFAFATAFLWH
jgi:hypothetical protein